MTRREALTWFETACFDEPSNYRLEVYHMAIAALREQEELARNSHDVASNEQVTEALCRNGFSDSAEPLATKNQVTSDWISVEDRLPENGHIRVLVHLTAYVPQGGNPRIDTDRYLNGMWVRWNGRVTHWMPLPEPPKEER